MDDWVGEVENGIEQSDANRDGVDNLLRYRSRRRTPRRLGRFITLRFQAVLCASAKTVGFLLKCQVRGFRVTNGEKNPSASDGFTRTFIDKGRNSWNLSL